MQIEPRQFKSRFYLSLFATILVALSSCSRGSETGLNPGDLGPDISAQAVDGTSVSLASFRGKLVLLNFWATWCSPCVSEMPALQRLYDKYQKAGFSIVAVAVDEELGAVREFQHKFGLSFPILIDQTGDSKRRYKTSGVPESFFLDPEGKLLMFPDPEDGNPTVRIIGPRDWDSPNVGNRISALLTKFSAAIK